MLQGDPDDLPELGELRAIVEAAKPVVKVAQQRSSIEQWRPRVEALLDDGAAATAIYDRLRVEVAEFPGTLSAVKRLVAAVKREKGVSPNDVAIPVETLPGKVAQVDFGRRCWSRSATPLSI